MHIFAPNGGYCSYSYLLRVTIVSSANKCSLCVLVFDVTLAAELEMTAKEFPDISFLLL